MFFILGAVACLASFLVTQQLRSPTERVLLAPQTSVPSLDSKQQLQAAKKERLVYPYSIIPGGVQSREELTSVMGSDSVVAEHYARFAVSRAKIVHATETQFVHVAYRLRNKVYWTAKKVKIPKGETLVTDGTDTARTRCGNRVSAVPLEPVSEEEPAIESFDLPLVAELEMPETGLEMSEIPDLVPFIPIPPLNPPAIPRTESKTYVRPTRFRPLFVVRPSEHVTPNDVVVPEPATLSLLSIGLAAFVAIRFARKK
jgi:hypothetical protein